MEKKILYKLCIKNILNLNKKILERFKAKDRIIGAKIL